VGSDFESILCALAKKQKKLQALLSAAAPINADFLDLLVDPTSLAETALS